VAEQDQEQPLVPAPGQQKRRLLYEAILPEVGVGTLKKTRISAKVLSDFAKIRVLWAQGYADIDIRKKLALNYAQWTTRLEAMVVSPPDEDALANFRSYELEHIKFIARSEARLVRLNDLYKKARVRDLDTANTTLAHMSSVDKEVLRSKGELLLMKQKLGILAEPPKKVMVEGVLAVSVVENVWKMRLKNKFKSKPIFFPSSRD